MTLPPNLPNGWHRVVHPDGHRYLRHADGAWWTTTKQVTPPSELAVIVVPAREESGT